MVLQLIASDRLHLDDPAGIPRLDHRITVRELLGQTSGVPDIVPTLPKPPSPGFFANRWRTWTTAELIDRALANPPVFQPPGSSWSYSSTNYLQLVERTTGQSYADEIDRRIIRPLHLTGTTLPGTSRGSPSTPALGALALCCGGDPPARGDQTGG